MEQGTCLDSTPVSAAQAVRDDAGADRALDAAITALLTRPSTDVPVSEGALEPEARIYGIGAALHRAVEAHRTEVERQVREGAETDGDDDANMDRLVALADVIRATPISTLADLRHKMIYLWSGTWPKSGFFVGELRSTLDSIRQDVMRLADADTIAPTASRPDPFADPNRHEGFIPMPAYKPTLFMEIQRAIPLEARRLLDVAQAQFDRRVPAYADFPPDERDAHIARMRSEYRLDQLEVLTWGEPDDEPVAPPLQAHESINRTIETHRVARAALEAACSAADEVAVEQVGGDTSDEAMAPARSAWRAAHEVEDAAFEAVLALRPNDPSGLAVMLRYIAETPALVDLDSPATAMDHLAQAAEAVAVSARGAKVSQAGPETFESAADPVLAAIAASRKAQAEMEVFLAETKGQSATSPSKRARESALSSAQIGTDTAVWRAVPTTRAGRLALVDYARFQARVRTAPDGYIDNAEGFIKEVLTAFASAIDAKPAVPIQNANEAKALALVDAIERARCSPQPAGPHGH